MRHLKIFATVILFLSFVGFTACSSDDGDGGSASDNPLVGTWCIPYYMGMGTNLFGYTFFADGTGYYFANYYVPGGETSHKKEHFTYLYDNGEVTLIYKDSYGQEEDRDRGRLTSASTLIIEEELCVRVAANASKTAIVGTWTDNGIDTEHIYTFLENGSGYEEYLDSHGNPLQDRERFAYVFNNGQVRVSDVYGDVMEGFLLSDGTLIVGWHNLRRVSY